MRRNIWASHARAYCHSGLCCTHDCGRVYTWSSLGLSLSDRCICHVADFSGPCTYCTRRLETSSHRDEHGIPAHQRFRRKAGPRPCLCLPHSRSSCPRVGVYLSTTEIPVLAPCPDPATPRFRQLPCRDSLQMFPFFFHCRLCIWNFLCLRHRHEFAHKTSIPFAVM